MAHLLPSPLDLPDWDTQVASLAGATIFHSAAWTRVLVAAYGYEPRFLVCREGPQLRAVLPLMEVESWLTGRRGISLPFTDLCPPLGPRADIEALTSAALALAVERRWKYIEFRGLPSALAGETASTSFAHHALSLRPDPDALLTGCDAATRRAIRKSEQSPLVVERTTTLEATRDFHHLLALTRRRHGVPPQPFSFFNAVQRHLLEAGHGSLFLARHQDRPVAGVLCLRFGGQVVYKYGASDDHGRDLRANHRVMWEAIRHYASTGATAFDFGRSSLTNEGLRRFKAGWGATEQVLTYHRHDGPTGTVLSAPDAAEGWYNRVFRLLPLPASRAIGSLLYRHVP